MNQAEQQVSSGLKIQQASDAPYQLADLFETRNQLAAAQQDGSNLTTIKAQTDAADSALQTAVQILDNVQSFGAEGASITTTAADNTGLAQQVLSALSQLVGLSQTNVNGVYIFSGDQSSQPAYQLDSSSPTGVDRLITAPATLLIQDPTGTTFGVALTAQQIFDARDSNDNPTVNNVFAAVNNLALALQSNNQQGIQSAIAQVSTAQQYLGLHLQYYGNVEDQISSAQDLATKFSTNLQVSLSDQQSADIPAAASQLTQDNTNLDAAMAAQAEIPRGSLFDYLK